MGLMSATGCRNIWWLPNVAVDGEDDDAVSSDMFELFLRQFVSLVRVRDQSAHPAKHVSRVTRAVHRQRHASSNESGAPDGKAEAERSSIAL